MNKAQMEEEIQTLKDQLKKVDHLLNPPVPCQPLLCSFGCKYFDNKMSRPGISKCNKCEKFVAMGDGECPAIDPSMKKYGFYCSNCDERLATAWSDSDHPEIDLINFHYDSAIKENGVYVRGCLAPSKAEGGVLAFECACGNDTRDFSKKGRKGSFEEADKKQEKENSIGRDWNLPDSKFYFKEAGEVV